jgi:hypothetical protein
MTIKAACTSSAAMALFLAASLGAVPTGVAAEDLPHSTLIATDEGGVPPGFTAEQWLAAGGEAEVVAHEDGEAVIEVEASNLVPEGLYTFWWVNERLIGMDMGPGGGVPGNEFRADAEGAATATLRVPADNDYETMVVAYHADDQTHGESPGEMGSETFQHLMGAWPGPAGEVAD